MNAWFNTFGFYTVDTSYMKLLNSIDSEVYYSNDPSYARKPYLGIVVAIGGYRCFIPLTSAKKRHEKWKRIDKSHFLVYETIDAKDVSKTDVIQRIWRCNSCLQDPRGIGHKKDDPCPGKVVFKSRF